MAITPSMLLGGIGAAGSLASMFGGNQPQNATNPYLGYFANQLGAANATGGSAAGAIGGLGQYNLGAQFAPGVSGIAQGYMNNPYAGGYQGGANQFGALGQGNALAGLGMAGMMGGTVPTQIGAGNAILNTAFDPQQALYNRTAQQVSDQSLAGLSNSGLAQTPWGQGVQGNTMSNFNIDWQNAQLGRQATGISGAESAFGGAGNTAAGAFNLGNNAWQGGVLGAQAPWGAYNNILGGGLQGANAAASYGNAISAIPQTQAGDWMNLMGGYNAGAGSALQGGNLALNAQGQGFNQQQTTGQNFGKSLAMMSGQYNPYGGQGGYLPGTNPYTSWW